MGDFNGKHISFGSTKTDQSGQILYDIIHSTNDDSPTNYKYFV